ncbi:TraX family protein [Salinicola salarius]|uniref:TraX family protein n=1 Tax=Salinicola salarius TaxID=430457 RepID=UPI0023E3D10B|nr:TraX family protein [Salinicola salarius]MDF3920040.1 TraX family protein [Salinicola salarius]
MITTINSQSSAPGSFSNRQALSNAWVPLAQWLAILTMTVEHVAKFLWPAAAFTPWAITLGRVAFPLFAGMVAWHLVHNTRRPTRYGLRLLGVGALAQLPYLLVVAPKLNVCFTLGLGLLAVVALHRLQERTLQAAVGIVLVILAATISPHVEYGLFGLLLVPAFSLAFRYPHRTAAAIPTLLLAAVINGSALHMFISTATAMTLVLLASGSLRLDVPIPAIPRPLRLSWYPLHLAVIAVIQAVIAARPSL